MKFLNMLLCMSLIFGTISPVIASEKTEVETALAEVKTRLDIGEYDEFQSEYLTDEFGKTQYYFSWENRDDEDYEYISVTYSDGVIIGYDSSFSGEYENAKKISDTSMKDAKVAAEEFLKKANPECYEDFEVISNNTVSLHDSSYYFSVIRTQNGIPVLGSGGNISISKNTNEVRYFHVQYDGGITFEKPENILSEAEAKSAYAEKLAPSLEYAYDFDYDEKKLSVFPRYTAQEQKTVLRAKDGSVYEIPERDYVMRSAGSTAMKNMAMAEDAAEERQFSPAELNEISNISGLMSEAEAEKAVRGDKIINISDDLKVVNIRLTRDYINTEKYVYSIRFVSENPDKYSSANVNLNAKTGEILYFNTTGDYEAEKQDLKKELKAADEALMHFAGDKYKEFKLEETDDAGYVAYVRIKDGIEVSGDRASFTFDGKDNLVNYSMNYTDIEEFPSVADVLTPAESFFAATEVLDFGLAYSIDYAAKKAVLVYSFVTEDRIRTFNQNPFTGKLIDYKGEEIKAEDKISYTDIEGHYAEEKFLKLAEFRIGFEGGVLEASKEITQSEYLKLLSQAFGYNTDIEVIYQRSISNGLITKEQRQDNSPVTRESAAVFMIKEMGADEYAKHEDIFVSPFLDVTENKGYIALLKAFGVVSGDGNANFNPKNNITRGEALIMIYNLLNK